MHTATQLARLVRRPEYRAPPPNAPPPPAFLTVPVAIVRKAVSTYHQQGAPAARAYIRASKVARWAGHANPSMATSNGNVLAGFEAYIAADRADGRAALELSRSVTLGWPAGPLRVRLDVVLSDGEDLAARAVLWDGPDITEAEAELIAAPYAGALAQLHPTRTITTLGVWQGRRQTYIEVPVAVARRQIAAVRRLQHGL